MHEATNHAAALNIAASADESQMLIAMLGQSKRRGEHEAE
jgi:hypothetical protein